MRTTITLTVYKVKYDTVVDASHFILHSALRLFGLKEILEKKFPPNFLQYKEPLISMCLKS
jgi:hypothetical protein